MRRFFLNRQDDVSGVSGIGLVAEGVEFSDGTVVLRWRGPNASTVVHSSMSTVAAVHLHGGKTRVEWEDK